MPVDGDGDTRSFVESVFLRPALLLFWLCVFWGTWYGFVLAWRMVREGWRPTLALALSGDVLAGYVNVGLTGLAVTVWSIVAVVLVRLRRKRSPE